MGYFCWLDDQNYALVKTVKMNEFFNWLLICYCDSLMLLKRSFDA